ncbi:MAG: methyltransferase domain-containing protein [Syntrophorhabdaceae bacterium]|nr:methyltransferase domain-containing protein [Syntrophorhabdaceae bacterium]
MEYTHIEWSKMFDFREQIHKRYKGVWDIPLIKRRSILFKRFLKDGMAVLDVGAGAKGAGKEIKRLGLDVTYKSMDIDRSIKHDYYDLDEIKEKFHAVLLFEVIEHLSLEDGINLLKKIYNLTEEDGILIASTPNIFNPSRFMRDATHKTFYAYDEFCGIVNMAGYTIEEVFRSYNDAFHRYVFKVYILGFLFKTLGIDYAYSVFLVGKK